MNCAYANGDLKLQFYTCFRQGDDGGTCNDDDHAIASSHF